MTILFKGGRPSDQELLEQAAGVGLTFAEGSTEEMWFLIFCNRVWTQGYCDGSDDLLEAFRTAKDKTQVKSELKA